MKTGDRSEIEEDVRNPKRRCAANLSVSASEGGNPSSSHDRYRCPPNSREYLFSSTYTSRSPLSPTPSPLSLHTKSYSRHASVLQAYITGLIPGLRLYFYDYSPSANLTVCGKQPSRHMRP